MLTKKEQIALLEKIWSQGVSDRKEKEQNIAAFAHDEKMQDKRHRHENEREQRQTDLQLRLMGEAKKEAKRREDFNTKMQLTSLGLSAGQTMFGNYFSPEFNDLIDTAQLYVGDDNMKKHIHTKREKKQELENKKHYASHEADLKSKSAQEDFLLKNEYANESLKRRMQVADFLNNKKIGVLLQKQADEERKNKETNEEKIFSQLGGLWGNKVASDQEKTDIFNNKILLDARKNLMDDFTGVASGFFKDGKLHLKYFGDKKQQIKTPQELLKGGGIESYYVHKNQGGVGFDVKMNKDDSTMYRNDLVEIQTLNDMLQIIQSEGGNDAFISSPVGHLGFSYAMEKDDQRSGLGNYIAQKTLNPLQRAMIQNTQKVKETQARGMGHRASNAPKAIIAPSVTDSPSSAFMASLVASIGAYRSAEHISRGYGSPPETPMPKVQIVDRATNLLMLAPADKAYELITQKKADPIINGKKNNYR